MRTLKYTPKMVTLLSAGKKLEAIKEARGVYDLQITQAKEMVNAYQPGGNNYYTFVDLDATPESIQGSVPTTQSANNTITENNHTLSFCCPNCGCSQVENSIGGKIEHAVAWAVTKAAKSYFMGDYGGMTGGVENDIIKEEVPFQQVCSYCHHTFHASKSQIESGKYSMSKSQSDRLTETYNRRLKIVKDKEVKMIKEEASKKLSRIVFAGAALLVGILIIATCELKLQERLDCPLIPGRSCSHAFLYSSDS